MHITRTLRFALIAGALVGAGCLSRGGRREGSDRGTMRPRRAAGTTPPTARHALSPNAHRTFMGLIADGAIEVTASGVSMQCVRMAIENRERSAFSFVIPTGTFLDSGSVAFQSMITTHDHPVSLEPRRTRTEMVPAACANLYLRGPHYTDIFQGVREPPDPTLVAILKSLDETGASPTARQMAVWIMTDDAGWAGPGTLFSGGELVRRSDEDDAALALWALDRNGVEITSKAIWAEAPGILAGLRDPFLKAWLEARC